MSYRRLGLLIAALPPESLTKTAAREALTLDELDSLPEPDGHGQWSHTDLLLASVVDGLAVLAWQQSQIHGGSKAAAPEPIRRPGVRPKTTSPTVSAAGLTYMSELRERRRQRGDSRR